MMLKNASIEAGRPSLAAHGAMLLRRLATERQILSKFLRFAIVGGGSGLIYAVVTWLLVAASYFSAPMASVAGYLAAVPLNFIGQKLFAFRADGNAGAQALRFAITTAVNIGLSFGIMWLSMEMLGTGVAGGIALTILSIPFVTFFVLDRWVFAAATSKGEE